MSKKLFLIFSFLLLSFLSPHSVSAADPTYDYYAKEIILEPTYPTVNQDVVIKIKVENKGSQAATSTAGLNNYLIEFDNFEKSSVTLPDITEDNAKQLRPGMEAFYTINGKFTIRGLRKLTFTIDPNNTFPETNENNNSVSRTIRVETYDDLAIED
ncbi:MAG: hypothetical protein NT091_00190, partial [Candidatus Falkowbacteria bacterium]|nr:hypothetical protein [Candidatus Falkowbacteria bacterium]